MSDYQRVGMFLIFLTMFVASFIKNDEWKALLWVLVLAVVSGVVFNLARQM